MTPGTPWPAQGLRRPVFGLVAGLCVLFVVLTVLAMLLYPGGSVADPQSRGYSFFRNFFSDLGQTETVAGHSNSVSMGLFIAALTLGALGLALFFVAFARMFRKASPSARLAAIAAVPGVATGLCFVGVALTPWNLYLQAHNQFVVWAFRLFLAAVVVEAAAVLREPVFPRRFAWVFAGFAVLLLGYVLLLTAGPPVGTPRGSVVQATGQKVIAYASILTVFVQAMGVRSWLRTPRGPS